MAEHSPVQSLDRAFDLLEILCRSRGGMTIGALSAQVHRAPSAYEHVHARLCAARCGDQHVPRGHAPVRDVELYRR